MSWTTSSNRRVSLPNMRVVLKCLKDAGSDRNSNNTLSSSSYLTSTLKRSLMQRLNTLRCSIKSSLSFPYEDYTADLLEKVYWIESYLYKAFPACSTCLWQLYLP